MVSMVSDEEDEVQVAVSWAIMIGRGGDGRGGTADWRKGDLEMMVGGRP